MVGVIIKHQVFKADQVVLAGEARIQLAEMEGLEILHL